MPINMDELEQQTASTNTYVKLEKPGDKIQLVFTDNPAPRSLVYRDNKPVDVASEKELQAGERMIKHLVWPVIDTTGGAWVSRKWETSMRTADVLKAKFKESDPAKTLWQIERIGTGTGTVYFPSKVRDLTAEEQGKAAGAADGLPF